MEALGPPGMFDQARGVPEIGYLTQPDMKALIHAAITLGWSLHGY